MKKMISLLLAVLMIVTAIPFAVNAELSADVPEGFTAVYDIDGLYGIRGNLAGKYILMADIDMTNDVAAGGDYDNGYGWAPIGENSGTPFSGTFDGNGHTITGLRCYNTKTTYVGLFGYVTGEVKNLTIANATLINNNNSEKYIGAVTGYISKGKISNVKVEDLVLSTNSSTSGSYYGYYGGIAGYSSYGTIENSSVTGSISINNAFTGSVYLGGIVGCSSSGTICKSYNKATIGCNSNATVYCGGIAGSNGFSAKISQSYNKADISCNSSTTIFCGGISGYSYVDSNVGNIIENCYNTGKVTTNNGYASGVLGYGYVYRYSSSYSYYYCSLNCCLNIGKIETEGTASGVAYFSNDYVSRTANKSYYLQGTASVGNNNGSIDTATTCVALTSTQVKKQSSYGHFDFENIWIFSEGMEYPQLKALVEIEDTGCKHANTEIINEKEATCSENGYTGDKVCSDCNRLLLAGYKTGIISCYDNDGDGLCDMCFDRITILIYDIDDLYAVRNNLSARYKLMADIDMTNDVAAGGDYDSGYGWAPIGENSGTPFSGTFDGNGHTITGLRCYNTKTTYVGLFGYVTGEVKNLTIANATLINNNNAEKYIGAVAGYISKGKISNVKVEDLVLSTNSSTSGSYYGYYGGIAGYSYYGAIENSSVTGSISINNAFTGSVYLGGIVGYSYPGTISKSYNKATIDCNSNATIYCGGIAGRNEYSAKISQSYNKADISCNSTKTIYCGGVSGYSYVGSSGGGNIIENCYNTGKVTTNNGYASGILGYGNVYSSSSNYYCSLNRCLNIGKIETEGTASGVAYFSNEYGNKTANKSYYLQGTASVGNNNGSIDTATTCVALTSTQVKKQSSYGNLDFENIWFLKTDMEYPQLLNNPEVAPCDHENTVLKNVVEVTCTTRGYTGNTVCFDCGKVIAYGTQIPALGHDMQTIAAKEPTCTEQGNTEGVFCTNCNYVESGTIIPAKGHTADVEVIENEVDSTCTTKGSYDVVVYCKECKQELSRKTIESDKVDHDCEIYYIAPTCTENGKVSVICKSCKMTTDKVIDALGHNYVDFTFEPTCTQEGYTKHYCANCGDEYIDTRVNALGHTMRTETIQPTCTENGCDINTCDTCGYYYSTNVVMALGHVEMVDQAVPATCTQTGLTEGSHCSVCGTVLVEQTETEMLDHNVVVDSAVAATCTSTGLTEGSHCSVCGTVLVEQTETEMLDHNVVVDSAVAATCTSTGLTEGSHCSDCGTVITVQEVVEKTDHTDSNSDKICDSCGANLQNDPPANSNCSCNCHKTGLAGLFYRIVLIFWKIFKTNKVCACGVSHY